MLRHAICAILLTLVLTMGATLSAVATPIDIMTEVRSLELILTTQYTVDEDGGTMLPRPVLPHEPWEMEDDWPLPTCEWGCIHPPSEWLTPLIQR